MLISVVGIGIIGAIATLFIRRYAPEYAMLTAIISGCVMLLTLMVAFSGVLDDINDIFSKTSLDNGIFKTVLKGLGICYLTGFATDVCRDFGQTSLGSKVELAGKVTVLILSLPLIKLILQSAVELIG